MATCYMCDKPASTSEHAPPKCFFPEVKDVGVDLRRDLITVPSCTDHNSSRSKDDEYAMIFVVSHFETNPLARTQFATKCIRAMRRSAAFTSRIFNQPRNVYVGGRPTVHVDVDRERFDRVIESTCRALFYHHHGRKLTDPLLVWSTAFRHPDLRTDPAEERLGYAARLMLKDQPRLGSNPEVFWYQIFEDPARWTIFRLEFYEGFSAYAVAEHKRPANGEHVAA